MKKQRGGFFLGLIVGLLVGLSLALGVALYIGKVPVPFVNKVPLRTADQDAAEAEKNKNWDPNSGLYGKNPARPSAASSGIIAPPSAPSTPPAANDPRDPAAILGDRTAAPAAASSPASSTKPASDPLITYFVQAGAFSRAEDAEQQRGKLAMMGLTARVTEREQAGRTVYRVRLGPFERRDEATSAKQKLEGGGVDASLIQVQK